MRDIITGLHRIGSKRPNNKVTSFPGNNRNSPSSSHHCVPVFIYYSIKSKGTLWKELRFSELSSRSNVFNADSVIAFLLVALD